jgi:hypothetical protein
MGEIEHIFERVGILVTFGQEISHAIQCQKAALDQGQHRRVFADGVGNVVRLRKWGDRQERNTNS